MAEDVPRPRRRGFLCTTTHPEGCAAQVRAQVAAAEAAGPGRGLGNVLVLGSSTGYGLASLITGCFGHGAGCLGVCFEREPGRRAGSPGWYNLAEAHRFAADRGRRLATINGDAFADATREEVVERLLGDFGPVDLVVYSLASPRRTDPTDGTVYKSVLKPIGNPYTGKTVDLDSGQVTEVSIDPADDDEIAATVKVMGGEDWKLWMDALAGADLLADGCRSVAYSYIGPEVTHPIYRDGTIGRAKEDLEATARELHAELEERGGGAWVSVNKAVVTQASAAIPVVPLYISLLFDVMKARGTHEGCIEQMVRLFADHLGPDARPGTDEQDRIRMDDRELAPEVQDEVGERWPRIATENLRELTDFEGFERDFLALYGFGVDGVDYEQPVEMERELVPTT